MSLGGYTWPVPIWSTATAAPAAVTHPATMSAPFIESSFPNPIATQPSVEACMVKRMFAPASRTSHHTLKLPEERFGVLVGKVGGAVVMPEPGVVVVVAAVAEGGRNCTEAPPLRLCLASVSE
jgi:hypothetical protein